MATAAVAAVEVGVARDEEDVDCSARRLMDRLWMRNAVDVDGGARHLIGRRPLSQSGAFPPPLDDPIRPFVFSETLSMNFVWCWRHSRANRETAFQDYPSSLNLRV